MYIVWMITAAIMITTVTKATKRIFNPINVYIVIWTIILSLYEMDLIHYQKLSLSCWMVIICALVVLFIGYILGLEDKVRIRKGRFNKNSGKPISQKKLKKIIAILIFISLIAILPNTVTIISRYGIDFMMDTTQIYSDNLVGNASKTIPYLGSFAQAAVICSGIYLYRFGFTWLSIMALVLSVLSGVPSGSRGYLIFSIIYYILPTAIMSTKLKYTLRKNWKILFLSMTCIIVVFLILTNNRSANIANQSYYSSIINTLASSNPSIVKNLLYITSPIAVLNAFISNPVFNFGANSFLPLANILTKVGVNIDFPRYQEFYYVPMRMNAGTWIRELIQDFGWISSFFVILFIGFILGRIAKRQSTRGNHLSVSLLYLDIVIYSMLIMSFYVWYLREGFVYVLLLNTLLIWRWTRNEYI